jgi:hypothetical protein
VPAGERETRLLFNRSRLIAHRWLLLLKASLAPIAGLNAQTSAMHAYAISASDAAFDATQMYLKLLQVRAARSQGDPMDWAKSVFAWHSRAHQAHACSSFAAMLTVAEGMMPKQAPHCGPVAAREALNTITLRLQGHANNVVLEASRPDKRRKLSTAEWLSLLDVSVEGRSVTKAQRANLRSTLDVRGGVGEMSSAGRAQQQARKSPLLGVEVCCYAACDCTRAAAQRTTSAQFQVAVPMPEGADPVLARLLVCASPAHGCAVD